MTVEVFKTFLHNTLLEVFPDVEVQVDVTDEFGNVVVVDSGNIMTKVEVRDNATLNSAVTIANQSYSALISNKPAKAVVRFDAQTFQLKTALCHVYEYVLQDDAILHALSLQTMSLSENQVFDNYYRLLQMEREDLEKMRKEFLDEVKDKEDDSKNLGVMLYHRYPRGRR